MCLSPISGQLEHAPEQQGEAETNGGPDDQNNDYSKYNVNFGDPFAISVARRWMNIK
jgi:hypothetical protein